MCVLYVPPDWTRGGRRKSKSSPSTETLYFARSSSEPATCVARARRRSRAGKGTRGVSLVRDSGHARRGLTNVDKVAFVSSSSSSMTCSMRLTNTLRATRATRAPAFLTCGNGGRRAIGSAMAEAIGDSHLRSGFGILAPQEQLNATRHVHCRDASGRDCSKERLRSPCCRVSRYDADWTLKYERGGAESPGENTAAQYFAPRLQRQRRSGAFRPQRCRAPSLARRARCVPSQMMLKARPPP